MDIARPSVIPGRGSRTGIFLNLNSAARVFAIAVTTKKFQTQLKKGTNSSHTIHGRMALDAGEHFLRVR